LYAPAWLQIMTGVLGRPVAVSGVWEASERGTALLALEALGVLTGVEDVPAFVGAVHQPDAGRHGVYRQAVERQRALYEQSAHD